MTFWWLQFSKKTTEKFDENWRHQKVILRLTDLYLRMVNNILTKLSKRIELPHGLGIGWQTFGRSIYKYFRKSTFSPDIYEEVFSKLSLFQTIERNVQEPALITSSPIVFTNSEFISRNLLFVLIYSKCILVIFTKKQYQIEIQDLKFQDS